jgi:hypothetical protein
MGALLALILQPQGFARLHGLLRGVEGAAPCSPTVDTASPALGPHQHQQSGRRSRRKGARTERSIVNALQAKGIAAVRVPLSGAVGGRFAGDIVLLLMGRDLCVEVKARADGFRELYCWLNGRDVLVVKADRKEPLVIVRLSLAAEIAKLAV